jgi:F420-non-reducing hydrogenase iron-sulfur subunit
MRAQYPANIRIIKVPCTGKVNEMHILKSLESGVDGVYVVGCEEGNCHFLSGNLRARKRVERVKRILDSIGIESDRVAMYNLSAGEGMKFVEYAIEMTEKIRGLGPSPIKPKEHEFKDASFQETT